MPKFVGQTAGGEPQTWHTGFDPIGEGTAVRVFDVHGSPNMVVRQQRYPPIALVERGLSEKIHLNVNTAGNIPELIGYGHDFNVVEKAGDTIIDSASYLSSKQKFSIASTLVTYMLSLHANVGICLYDVGAVITDEWIYRSWPQTLEDYALSKFAGRIRFDEQNPSNFLDIDANMYVDIEAANAVKARLQEDKQKLASAESMVRDYEISEKLEKLSEVFGFISHRAFEASAKSAASKDFDSLNLFDKLRVTLFAPFFLAKYNDLKFLDKLKAIPFGKWEEPYLSERKDIHAGEIIQTVNKKHLAEFKQAWVQYNLDSLPDVKTLPTGNLRTTVELIMKYKVNNSPTAEELYMLKNNLSNLPFDFNSDAFDSKIDEINKFLRCLPHQTQNIQIVKPGRFAELSQWKETLKKGLKAAQSASITTSYFGESGYLNGDKNQPISVRKALDLDWKNLAVYISYLISPNDPDKAKTNAQKLIFQIDGALTQTQYSETRFEDIFTDFLLERNNWC